MKKIDLTSLNPRNHESVVEHDANDCFIELDLATKNYDVSVNKTLSMIMEKYKGRLSDKSAEITKYLNQLIRPIKKHDIHTIGILYQKLQTGGVETFIINLIPILQSMGYKVVLIGNILNSTFNIPANVVIEPIEVFLWNDDQIISNRMNHLKEIITRNGIDLVFSQEYCQTMTLFDLVAINQCNCYSMVTYHNNPAFLFFREYGRFLFDFSFECLKYFNKVIALSQEHVELFKLFGVKSTYIPNVVSDKLISIAKEKRQKFNNDIVWIGRVCDQKMPLDALLAFDSVHKSNQNAKMTFICSVDQYNEGLYQQMLKKRQELGLVDCVQFLGDQPNDTVLDTLKCSRVLCYTGKFDGYPYVIAEAIATGIPIVAYEQQEIELFKACPKIIQCQNEKQLYEQMLLMFNLDDCALSSISELEKKVFLDIYDNDKIKQTYREMFMNMDSDSIEETTIFGKMLYRYIKNSIKG